MKRVIRASTGPIKYVIKDAHGNQLSAPNADDNELWNRVASMEARGKRGLSVVAYVPQEGSADPGSWLDVYKQFEAAAEEIIDKYGFDHAKINRAVNKIYQQGKGSHAYEEAWIRWNDYSEENLEDEPDVNSSEKIQSNAVTSKLTPALSRFLEDIAQETDAIDYLDIMNHDYTDSDIKRIKALRRKWINQCEDFDEEELAQFGYMVSDIFKSDIQASTKLQASNQVSAKLPESLDMFLQDIAQATGAIDYNDIIDHEYNQKEINRLKYLRRKYIEEGEAYDDEELFALGKKVHSIFFSEEDVNAAYALSVGTEIDLRDAMDDMLYEIYQNYYSDWLDGKYDDSDIIHIFIDHMIEEYDTADGDVDLADACRDYMEGHMSDYFC